MRTSISALGSTLLDGCAAQDLVARTGVAALLGYRKDVDWLEGAAFEVILLAWLANHTGHPATVFKRLIARHGDLARLYKFAMVTKNEQLRNQDHSKS